MTQSQQSQEISGSLGNIEPNSSPKKNSRGRKWVFTLNNYTPLNVTDMNKWIDNDCKDGGFGEEVAPTTGTPHMQGFLHFKNQKTFNQIKKKFPRMWFEKMKGNKSQNLKYCSKDGIYHGKKTWKQKLHARLLAKYDNIIWKEWQQYILDYIMEEPDDREIFWIWEGPGSVGKSFLARYIVLKHQAVIANGKKDNVFNQIKICLDEEREPKIIILDIPRHQMDYLNYGCLEQLKNGMLYSGKYEGGICLFEHPHVIVFANTPPLRHKMSEDRWTVLHL